MAEQTQLDLNLLVSPIPGSDPAGAPLPDDIRRKFDEMRREPDPFDVQSGASDKKADWVGVITLAEEALTTKSKDLLVAIRLTEALAKKEGFPGLAQGLTLLNRLVNECWDRVYPKPEAGNDYTARIGPFLWMNHATKGARFPNTVANLELFKPEETVYSYVFVSENAKQPQRDEFERVFESLKLPELQGFKKTADAVRASFAALKDLGAALDKHFGTNAPDFLSVENPDNLGRTMHGCIECVNRLLKKSGLEGAAAAPGGEGASVAGTTGEPAGELDTKRASREALYRQLSQIADALIQIEPHSPIPYLLKRVVKLGGLAFPELMRELVRENATIQEFDRLLGIKKDKKDKED